MKKIAIGILAVMCGIVSGWAETTVPQDAQKPADTSVMGPVSTPQTWVDYLTLKGDVRLRYDQINDDAKKNSQGEDYTRDRFRLRARLGAEANIDDLKAVVRLSTGGANPLSGNQTMGNGFQKDEIRLDLGYLDYKFFGDTPCALHVIGGKMDNPLITFTDDLMWDPDLTPEGVAAKWQVGNDFVTFLANGEGLYIQQYDTSKNTTALGGQAALKFKFTPEVALLVGGSCEAFQNIKGNNVIDWQNANGAYGNSTINGSVSGGVTNKAWADNFTPVEGFAELDLQVGLPLAFYGQALTNPSADDYKNGFMGGVSLGKAKNPKTFEVGYNYVKLEKNATLGMFTDDDRFDGNGTDGEGSRFYGKYQITKNLQACATFFLDKKNISNPAQEANTNHLMLDLMASF